MMKRSNSISAGFASILLATFASAQSSTQPPAPARPTAAAAVDLGAAFDSSARSPEAVAKAMVRLESMRKAYHDAPTITDNVTLKAKSPSADQSDKFGVTLGKGTDASVALQGAMLVAVDGKVTLVPEVPADKAVQVPLEGNLLTTAAKFMSGFALPMPHFALRYGAALNVADLSMATFQNARIAGYRENAGEAQVFITGDGGQGVLSLDATTNLLRAAQLQFVPQGAPEGFSISLDMTYAPTVADELAKPITLEIGTREIVASLADLAPKPVPVGSRSPEWTLKRADGGEVSLASLRGSVVVIDLWATWCGPCKRGLPFVNEFAQWAASSGKKIQVFGVNTLERGDAAARIKAGTDYWTGQSLTMPLLFDLDDSVFRSYGLDGIPATIVIGPDGTITKIHAGIDPQNPGSIVEDLKKEATALLTDVH